MRKLRCKRATYFGTSKPPCRTYLDAAYRANMPAALEPNARFRRVTRGQTGLARIEYVAQLARGQRLVNLGVCPALHVDSCFCGNAAADLVSGGCGRGRGHVNQVLARR